MGAVHWIEVDGHPMPKRYGGHAALDFCNTWAGWGEPPHPRREWLTDFDRLAVWCGYADLIDDEAVATLRQRATRRRDEAATVLAAARKLRTALYDVLTNPTDERAFRRVASHAHRAASAAVLTNGSDGVARWRLPTDAGLPLPLLVIGRAAAGLLCAPDRTLVRACPGHGCGWLFLDRRGRRRWCSMATCGNRAKARGHSLRHRSP